MMMIVSAIPGMLYNIHVWEGRGLHTVLSGLIALQYMVLVRIRLLNLIGCTDVIKSCLILLQSEKYLLWALLPYSDII